MDGLDEVRVVVVGRVVVVSFEKQEPMGLLLLLPGTRMQESAGQYHHCSWASSCTSRAMEIMMRVYIIQRCAVLHGTQAQLRPIHCFPS